MADESTLEQRIRTLEVEVTGLRAQVGHLSAQVQQRGAPDGLGPPVATPVQVPDLKTDVPPAPDLEARIGAHWLGRAGILALTTGIAFLIVYRFGNLGPIARIVLGYLLAAGLSGLGLYLCRRHDLLGRLVVGGGLAVAYFVTFALHFVPSVRVIDSEPLAFGLLALVVVGIVASAQALKSETVAGFAMFLGLHAGLLSHVGTFTLLSSTLLAGGAVFFLVRNRWVVVPTTSLLGVYSTHAVFALRHGSLGVLDLSFAAIYFTLFTAALLLRPAGLPRRFATSFALLNWLGAFGLVLASAGADRHPIMGLAGLALGLVTLSALAWPLGAFPHVAPVYLPAAVFTAACAVQLGNIPEPSMIIGLGGVAVVAGRALGHGSLAATGAVLLALQLAADTLPWHAAATSAAPMPLARLALLAVLFFGCERLQASRWHIAPPPLAELADTPPWPGLLAVIYPLLTGATLLILLPLLIAGRTWAWLVAAILLSGLGFALRARGLRWMGLLALALSVLHFLAIDLAQRSTDYRIVALLLLGAVLLGTSYAYSRLRDRIRRWL